MYMGIYVRGYVFGLVVFFMAHQPLWAIYGQILFIYVYVNSL